MLRVMWDEGCLVHKTGIECADDVATQECIRCCSKML